MARPSTKKRSYDFEDSDFEDDEDSRWQEPGSDSDYDPKADKPRAKKRAKIEAAPKARTKASISLLATNILPEQAAASERLSNVDASILARIKKSLALASHSGTGEQEAKAALRMASKLMARHNIDQADVLAEESESDRLKRAGMSVVTITSLVDGTVRHESWSGITADAMCVFFDCKYYSESFDDGERLNMHFYGLAEQTVAAAHGFEMAYNLILELSHRKKEAKGIRGKNTYRRGVGDGLRSLAKREKQEEHNRTIEAEKQKLLLAKREEEREDRRRLERLVNPKIENADDSMPAKETAKRDGFVKIEVVEDDDVATLAASRSANRPLKSELPHIIEREESPDSDFVYENGGRPIRYKDHRSHGFNGYLSGPDDDESDNGSFDAWGNPPEIQPDFRDDDDDDMYLNPEDLKPTAIRDTSSNDPIDNAADVTPPVKEEDPEPGWRSVQQLVQFRTASVAIADDFLKESGIKLYAGRKDTFALKREERALYNQGREDAKKIDVKRKRIKAAEED